MSVTVPHAVCAQVGGSKNWEDAEARLLGIPNETRPSPRVTIFYIKRCKRTDIVRRSSENGTNKLTGN